MHSSYSGESVFGIELSAQFNIAENARNEESTPLLLATDFFKISLVLVNPRLVSVYVTIITKSP